MAFLGRLWRHIRAKTRRNFLTGLLVIVPLGLTYYVVSAIVVRMDGVFAKLPVRFRPETYLPVPGIGVIVTLLIIQLVGMFSANLFGRTIVRAYENILDRIPLVRAVYNAVKQLIEAFGQLFSDSSDRFNRVVLVEYPRKGIYSLGFVTGKSRKDMQEFTDKQLLNVFIPTTPNPTSGFFLMIPEEDVTNIDINVEQAFKMLISAGMVNSAVGKKKNSFEKTESSKKNT